MGLISTRIQAYICENWVGGANMVHTVQTGVNIKSAKFSCLARIVTYGNREMEGRE